MEPLNFTKVKSTDQTKTTHQARTAINHYSYPQSKRTRVAMINCHILYYEEPDDLLKRRVVIKS
jgi:hypothetical protein